MPDDPSRVYDGFRTLFGGVNGALDASLISQDQCAFAKDATFRKGFFTTRPPWSNLIFTFDSDETESNFTGKFQGATPYISPSGFSGFVISVGGRLFLMQLGASNIVSEITPSIVMATAIGISATQSFTVPALNGNVLIPLNTALNLAVNQILNIDGGTYLVQQVLTDAITAQYTGGTPAHAIVASGIAIQDVGGNIITVYQTNPAAFDLVFLFQAETYVIALAQQQGTVIFDGTVASLATANQLPSGVFGIYENGRIWITKNDRQTFIAGDLVRSSSGTAAHGFVDSILYVTENDLLAGGGAFSAPSSSGLITSMSSLATMDTSLGLGQLLNGTTQMVFSVNAPVDRTTWQNLTYPIATKSVIEYGPQGPRSTVPANSDLWYRSSDGIRSFKAQRQDFQQEAQTPDSNEVMDVLNQDDQSLLIYGSAMLFNNRLYYTVSPYRTSGGIAHRGMVVINFDPSSTMRMKLPPCWDGLVTGINVLQLLKATFNDVERGFSFVLNDSGAIELWEFQKDGSYDQFINGDNVVTRSAIQPVLETRRMPFGDDTQLKSLYTLELYLDQIIDTVTVRVLFRPDEYPTWTEWNTLSFCSEKSQCELKSNVAFQCQFFKNNADGYAARVMLPTPETTPNLMTNVPITRFYEIQFRLEITGHCRIRKFKAHAKLESDRMEGSCPKEPVCSAVPYCPPDNYTYDSHGI